MAKGAAILGNTLQGNAMTAAGTDKSLLLLDVTPMSLSIETVGGVATRLIERNSTIPTRYSKIFTTAAPYQTAVDINVLQGERPMAKDNKSIGKFKLKGIRKAMAGVPQIEVTFDIDANGIIKVSAKDLDTGKEQAIVVTANDRMSDAEVEQAIKDAQQYASIDNLRTEALEVLGEAQSLLSKTEQALKQAGKDIDKAEKKQIKKDCGELQKKISKMKVDKVTEEQLNELRQVKVQLEISSAGLRGRFSGE